jgi:hypothetical protein
MNRANYTGQEAGYYPLRSDSLEFIQQQIKFWNKLRHVIASNVNAGAIIKEPAPMGIDGLILLGSGEFVNFKYASSGNYLNLYEVRTDLTEGDNTFAEYQVTVYAQRGTKNEPINGAVNIGSYPASNFSSFRGINDIDADLQSLIPHKHTGADGSLQVDYASIKKPSFGSPYTASIGGTTVLCFFRDYGDFKILRIKTSGNTYINGASITLTVNGALSTPYKTKVFIIGVPGTLEIAQINNNTQTSIVFTFDNPVQTTTQINEVYTIPQLVDTPN